MNFSRYVDYVLNFCYLCTQMKNIGQIKNARVVLFLLILSVLLSPVGIWPVFAQTPAQEFAASPAVNADKCAVLIYDLKKKKVIDSHNSATPLIPASINKALTIASTLDKTDIDYKYHTKVYLGGKIHDGCLDGDLIIVGGGDPTLGTAQGPQGLNFVQEIVSALKKKKVVSIKGEIRIDSHIFPAPATIPSWQNGDLRHAYGTGCYGFNWQHNASGKSAIHDPEAKFKSQLKSALLNAGIKVEDQASDSKIHGKPIVDFKSEPISEIMRYCMKQSDNLYAETFLRTLALVSNQDASATNGADIELKYWRRKGCPMQGVAVYDGSGLSRSNRLTADFLAEVMVKKSTDADYVSFFPLAGIEGTLKSFLKDTPLQDYIALKTGSMNGIQCYAGYMLDDDYAPTHVVVVMINDMPRGRADAKNAVKNMLLKTFVK